MAQQLYDRTAEDLGNLVGLEHVNLRIDNQGLAQEFYLSGLGLTTLEENDTTCCYALQDKVWVHGPGDEPWEVYTVKADAPAATSVRPDGGSGPCECGTP